MLSLAYLDRVAVQEGPREEAPITAIPLSEIEPFLKNLRVVDEFEHLPYVVGLEEDRLRSVDGQVVYVRGLADAQPGQRYAVVRPTVRFNRRSTPTRCCDELRPPRRGAGCPRPPQLEHRAACGATRSRTARASSSATNWCRSPPAPSPVAKATASRPAPC